MNEQRPRDLRFVLVICLYSLIAVRGIFSVVAPEHGLIRTLFALGIASCATVWVIKDSRRMGLVIVHIVQILILFTWPIAIPIYLIWSRGLRGLGLAVLHAFGVTFTLYVFYLGTIFVLYGSSAFVVE